MYDALADELRNERLCVAPQHAKIFRKKAYYSRDREADITTDVSIEVFLPTCERPTLVWVFKCKDYTASLLDDWLRQGRTSRTFESSGPSMSSVGNSSLTWCTGTAMIPPWKTSGAYFSLKNDKTQRPWPHERMLQQ